jgi:hypothetical protein
MKMVQLDKVKKVLDDLVFQEKRIQERREDIKFTLERIVKSFDRNNTQYTLGSLESLVREVRDAVLEEEKYRNLKATMDYLELKNETEIEEYDNAVE